MLLDRALAWMAQDPDPETVAATEAMLHDPERLAEHFGQRLTFGTAGLRGALGPGPNRMNRALVRLVSAALAQTVKERVDGTGPVVIGNDARIGSEAFAQDAAQVIAGAGLPVVRFRELCPTPLLAYAVRVLNGRAGVMVTASHNPPGDNGYKVYGPDGAQIVSPFDRWVTDAIDSEASPQLSGAPIAEPPGDLIARYLREVLTLRVHVPTAPIRIAYTPLHGVGASLARRVLAAGGYTDVHVVAEQEVPDGTFPTVRFPNPEEPGALDLAVGLAKQVGADVVLANDPDADRIAVAIPQGDGFRLLTGNEVGCLLAEDLLANGPKGDRHVATTLVSSMLLSRIAAAHGARFTATHTGFKWIAKAALAVPQARFVLGYEEALGVCAGEVVRDKDGLSAALLVADLVAHLKGRGETLADAIDALHRAHGVHLATQVTTTRPGQAGAAEIAARMAQLRAVPPTSFADDAVVNVTDYQSAPPAGLTPANLLAYSLRSGARVLFRPSGTEPKLKSYLEVVVAGADLARARADAALALAALERAVVERLSS